MPSFFNGLTQAATSYLRLLVESGKNLVSGATEVIDSPLEGSEPLDPSGSDADFTDIVAASGVDAAEAGAAGAGPVRDFVSSITEHVEQFLDPSNARVDDTPRGFALLGKIVLGRIAAFLPRGTQRAGSTMSISKLLGSLWRGLSLDSYRPEIVDGRIVGRHSKLYLLLAHLNEYVNPRDGISTADAVNAYFRDPVDGATGEALKWVKLSQAETGTAAPTVAAATVMRMKKDPEGMRSLAMFADKLKNVDRASFVKIAQEYYARARERMLAATEDLASSRITFGQYRQTMQAEIRRNILAQTILNIGGIGNLTDRILDSVHQRIKQAVQGLDDFIGELKDRGRNKALQGKPDLPDTDALPGQTVESGLTSTAASRLANVVISEDSYADEGIITEADQETAGKFATSATDEGQAAFRTLVEENANEYQLLEVRRLEEGIENCEFCIEWADKPMPPGQLPPIGDSRCLGVRYNTGGCHCIMDVATDEEIEDAADGD